MRVSQTSLKIPQLQQVCGHADMVSNQLQFGLHLKSMLGEDNSAEVKVGPLPL